MSEDDVLQAGELALGVLAGEERAVALRRVLAEPGFAAEVTRWRRELAVLLDAVPEVAAPAGIEARLIDLVQPERRAGRWRSGAIAASLVAAGLAGVTIWQGRPVAPPPVPAPVPARVLVAALGGSGEGKPFSAVYDERSARVAVVGAAPWAADRSAELWVIAPGAAPKPLGLLARGERSSVAVRGEVRGVMAVGATLAVSIEPRGGSPTGAPTGPVVASGGLVSG